MSLARWPSLSGLNPLPRIRAATTRRAHRWAKKRQGSDGQATRLLARRIYILPTGVGLIFALMAFAMLLGSMNYNNNLSFVLTFLLIGLGFVSMHQCQRNLVGLNVRFAGAEPVFAGQHAEFRVVVANSSRNTRFRLGLYNNTTRSRIADVEAGDAETLVLALPTETRGWMTVPRFGLQTFFPFELFRAWTWLHMDVRILVYPQPAEHAPQQPPSHQALGHRQHDARGEEDFAGLKRFVPGDSPRNVAWKAYARSNQLLCKRFSGADMSSQWFEFAAIENADTERRLSILTRWVIDADSNGEDYGLRLPGFELPPAHGDEHRRACLEALALFQVTNA